MSPGMHLLMLGRVRGRYKQSRVRVWVEVGTTSQLALDAPPARHATTAFCAPLLHLLVTGWEVPSGALRVEAISLQKSFASFWEGPSGKGRSTRKLHRKAVANSI